MTIIEYISTHWVQWLFAAAVGLLGWGNRKLTARLKAEQARNEAVDADAGAGEEQPAEAAEAADSPGDSENELELLVKKVAALEKERDDFKDQYLRKSADFDNYRKRMIKEKQDAFIDSLEAGE